jgi:hypothetical protein
MKRAYGLNMYEMICNPDMKPWKIKENNIVVNVYATKRWMLRDFNRKFFEKLEKRESVYEIELIEWCVWKEVWLTKDWFVKLWAIKLANKDYPTLAKDFKYIKNKYSELLIIDEFHKDHKKNKNKEEKTWIVKMFKKYLKKDKKKKG